ncbi:MAG TPA: hypothetical protein VKE40_25650, partial [Gemmataceae bacterium]|nr:hypothetical protein [Gemmataceae bacterium]
MMPGMGMETSLIETSYALLMLLLFLVFVAVIAGFVNLPVFFGALVYKISWFRAADVSSPNLLQRLLGAAGTFGLPAFSFLATVLSLGYFGAFDWPARLVGAVKGNKPGPVQAAVKGAFDDFTKRVGERAAPALPQDVKINWHRCPDKARELVELWEREQQP